jgi:CheY-like chemotaxis protein
LGRQAATGLLSSLVMKAPPRLLIAEDEEDSIEILRMAFKHAGATVPLHFVRDGEDAIRYLKGEEHFNNRTEYPLPRVVVLDLKMPRVNGFDVLDWLRIQPGLRRLPVIVLTSSDDPKDIMRAYEMGANSYLVKPNDFSELQELARYLEEYWLKLNRCPECTPDERFSASSVRVVVRDTTSGQYFQSAGRWTSDARKALNFERCERAIKTVLEMRLSDAEIIIETSGKRFAIKRVTAPGHSG